MKWIREVCRNVFQNATIFHVIKVTYFKKHLGKKYVIFLVGVCVFCTNLLSFVKSR